MTLSWEDAKNLFFILVGIAAILIGLLGKQFYYSIGFNGGQGKPAPRWYGVTLFVVVGLLFVTIGLIKLLRSL